MSLDFRPIQTLSRTASATLAAHRFLTVAGAVPANGAVTFGVTQSAATSGQLLPVVTLGTARVEAGDAVTAGAVVMTDNQGRAVPHTSTNAKVGYALTAATAAGQFIEVFLIPNA
jgi:hypothetical protein